MPGIYGELQSAQLEKFSAAPSNAPRGRIYFDTTLGAIRIHDGTAWRTILDDVDLATVQNDIDALELEVAGKKDDFAVLPIAEGGTGETTAGAALLALLPSVGGQSGKYLKTDGTTVSWETAGGGGGGGGDYWKDAVTTLGDLPLGDVNGAIRLVLASSTLYRYNGSSWVQFYAKSDITALDSRVGVLEGDNLDARLDVLEGQNLNSRLTAAEGEIDALQLDIVDKADTTYVDAELADKVDSASGTASRLTLDFYSDLSVAASPAAPSFGKVRFYAKSDGKLYKKDSTGVEFELGAGLTPVSISSTGTSVINTVELIDVSGGPVTRTLPTIPAGGGVITFIDAAEECSPMNYIRITPATGQSLDNYPTNDSLVMRYVRASISAVAAPGATSWKLQYIPISLTQVVTAGAPGLMPGMSMMEPLGGRITSIVGPTSPNVSSSSCGCFWMLPDGTWMGWLNVRINWGSQTVTAGSFQITGLSGFSEYQPLSALFLGSAAPIECYLDTGTFQFSGTSVNSVSVILNGVIRLNGKPSFI